MYTDLLPKQTKKPGYSKSSSVKEILTLETQSTQFSSGGAITPTSDIESMRETFNIAL